MVSLRALTLWSWQQGTYLLLRALPWPCRPIRMKDGLLGHETVVFLGDTHTAEEVPPFAQPSALWKAMSHHHHHHQQRLEDNKATPCWPLLNLRESSAYSHDEKVTSSCGKKKKKNTLSGNFPSLACSIKLLKDSISSPFVHTLQFLYRQTLAKKCCLYSCLCSMTYLSNMTTPQLQNWLIPILPSSNFCT